VRTRIVIALLVAPLTAAIAQESSTSGATVTVTPQPHYEAHGLKEKFLGTGWRDLWTKPVRIPLLNLDAFDVGERGGGRQSLTLRLKERGGWREYSFKSVDKFPVAMTMPPALRGTTVGGIVQDQVTTSLPAAPILVSPIMDAIHALNVPAEMRVMPDDRRLGDHRVAFANMLGTIELNPQEGPDDSPGFAGSKKIEGGDKFLEDVEESRENRLNESELFAVRLADFIINDNDRSVDNIRFARFGEKGNYTWRPLARDRDRARGAPRGEEHLDDLREVADAREERDVLAHEALRVAAAVEELVMR